MSLLIGPCSLPLKFDTTLIRSLIARGELSRLNSPCFKSEHVRLVRRRVRVSKRLTYDAAACLRARGAVPAPQYCVFRFKRSDDAYQSLMDQPLFVTCLRRPRGLRR